MSKVIRYSPAAPDASYTPVVRLNPHWADNPSSKALASLGELLGWLSPEGEPVYMRYSESFRLFIGLGNRIGLGMLSQHGGCPTNLLMTTTEHEKDLAQLLLSQITMAICRKILISKPTRILWDPGQNDATIRIYPVTIQGLNRQQDLAITTQLTRAEIFDKITKFREHTILARQSDLAGRMKAQLKRELQAVNTPVMPTTSQRRSRLMEILEALDQRVFNDYTALIEAARTVFNQDPTALPPGYSHLDAYELGIDQGYIQYRENTVLVDLSCLK